MDSVSARVARRFLAELREGPLAEWLGSLLDLIKDMKGVTDTYTQIVGKLGSMQAVLSSNVLDKKVRDLEREADHIKVLANRVSQLRSNLEGFDRDYLEEVRRAAKEAKSTEDFEYYPFKSRVTPLLGEVRKLNKIFGLSPDWMVSWDDLDSINAELESKSFEEVIKMFEGVPDLSDSGGVLGDIENFLDEIDDNLEEDIYEELKKS